MMMPLPETPQPRAALQFALDVTGGRDIVYRVAVYLQELLRKLQDAPGFSRRARIDILLFDGQTAQSVPLERLLESASAAAQGQNGGARFLPLYQQIRALPYEGGAFHTFFLLTRNPAEGWANEVTPLLRLVASVTSLCCGPDCAPDVAIALSKDPGGTRIVNPLDQISRQFDSIALWLTQHFAERFPPPPAPPPAEEAPLPITRPLQPAQWRVQEPQDHTDPVPHTAVARSSGAGGWQALAASRRGKLHAHEGSYREDAFALSTHEDWLLIAVADGAGSCRLSRVGARVASEAAVAGMAGGLRLSWPPDA
ncbi:MAG: protein phosphatase 2C domain-containing protein, partial [Ktedonobacterales bacterium]|nr:protein phosphatase 2C domain-containing protein [Ktedonobacterales bacterium]